MEQRTSSNPASPLKAREWLAIAVVVIAVALLTALTQFKGYKAVYALPAEQGSHHRMTTEVVVKGAVHFPGTYQLVNEMTIGTLLKLAMVKPDADLGKMRLDTVIRKTRLVYVKEKAQITVYLTGAVKNAGAVKVNKGTTLEELLKTIDLDEDAHLEAFKGKRKLKENELIEIPFK